jgi:hypothetical protein
MASRQLNRPFEAFDGLKILMKQDEHVQTSWFAEYIAKSLAQKTTIARVA